MIDTHCHVLSEYYCNIDELIQSIKNAGVEKIIVNGTSMKSNLEVLELVKKYDIVYGAIGFQPTELDDFKDDNLKWLEEHLGDDKIVAIGEIGLDYHYENTNKELQKRVFKKQLELASFYNKPIIVHSRDSIKDTYDMINNYNLRGCIHCFSGSVEMAREFVKLGFYLGIGGVVTYKNAKNLINVINDISLEYILLETDSPYLTPEPFRGGDNSPEFIPIIAKKIAEIKEVNIENVEKITTDNANRLFDF